MAIACANLAKSHISEIFSFQFSDVYYFKILHSVHHYSLGFDKTRTIVMTTKNTIDDIFAQLDIWTHSNHVTSSELLHTLIYHTTIRRDFIHHLSGHMILGYLKVVQVAYTRDVVPRKNTSGLSCSGFTF